jgi:hypothetical protein
MSDQSPRRPGLLSGFLSVAGGVAFLVVASINAAAVFPIDAMAVGIGVWLVAVFVTFRWYSRDVPSQRGWKARLARGGLFALTPPLCGLALWVLVALLFPHANPDVLGRTVAGITMLAPTAFGIGMLTGK